MTDSQSRGSEQARPEGIENLRKRSIEDSLATSQGLVSPVAAPTTGAEAIDNNVQGPKKRRSGMLSSGGSGEDDAAHAGIRPSFERFAGEEKVADDMAQHRRRSTKQSLTDSELQQVLGHLTDTNGPSSKRRVSASTNRAVLVGSSKSLGLEETKREDMRKFMEHVAHQPKATYVPIACAEKILKEAEAAAEAAKLRHHNAISTFEATYRAIDEKTKWHYESLILHLQREAGRQLLLMVNEKKEQDEVVESLRDMIASLTAAAAAQERRHVAMRERDRLEREREAAEFCVMKAELVEENMRALEAVSSEAEQSVERVEAGRLEESRRRSVQRVELEFKAARATVSLALERIVRAVEGREESQGRAALANSLSTVRREADELRMQLEQALLVSDTMRGETVEIGKERDDVRAENLSLKAKLEAMDEQQKQEHALEAASLEHTELSRVATELEETKTAFVKQRKTASALAGRLELSDKKKTFLKTAVGEMQENVTKMLADAPLPSSPDGTASAARRETEKEGTTELAQILAKLQETIAGFERLEEEEKPRENELEITKLGEAFTDTDFSGERRRSSTKELDITQRELENLRERERDARGEADGMVEAVERARASQEQQQGREAELVSEVEALEDEREMLSRGVIMAQERAALAMELVEAHTEEAAKARQESALNAAKFRRVSREITQPTATAVSEAAPDGETASLPEGALGKIPPSAGNRRTAEQLRLASTTLVQAIKEGSDLWRRNKREECHSLYAKAGIRAAGQMPPGQALDDLRVAMTAAKGMGPVKAAIALRKAFDTVIETAMEAKKKVAAQRLADRTSSKSSDGAGEDDVAEQFAVSQDNSKVASLQRQLEAMLARQTEMDKIAALAASTEESKKARGGVNSKTSRLEGDANRCSELEAKVEELQALLDAGPAIGADAGPGGTSVPQKRTRTDQDKIKSLENKNREEVAKAKKLEAQIAKLEAQISSGAAHGDSSGSKADSSKIKGLESKIKKVTEESERKVKKVERDLEAASKGWDGCKAELSDVRKERDDLRKEVEVMGSMGEELQFLRAKAEEAARLQIELDEVTASTSRIQKLYQDEQVLRKKYWNMMEDMKGKIRVYARCRPFAQYEISRNCKRAARFLDETTIEVDGHHGAKQFVFDNVFTEEHNQEAVFQETKNLIQSALDGFNVCVFAYGQTGSGKTWTMTGGKDEQRGISPRVVEEIFANIHKSKGATEVQVSCYFIELYLDNLRDLFFAMDHPNRSPPKLEIKLDANKMVVVKNVVIKEVKDANELLHLFTQGNHQRKVGGTKMNAESSRSHSIFSILLEAYNRMTKKSTSGKFSLVDLAGSERADKTGATADRLKEAQSINKSLSALGDVISALSTNEKFIPYRNNKLTQVMQDSLGGNAKTLMFVNISPADYNQDETVTALTYATRVKLITNTAEKQQDGEEIARLKEIIRKLKAGERHAEQKDDE